MAKRAAERVFRLGARQRKIVVMPLARLQSLLEEAVDCSTTCSLNLDERRTYVRGLVRDLDRASTRRPRARA